MSRRSFTTEQIEQALWTLALHAGKPTAASEALKSQGLTISKQLLHDWQTERHAERYEQIRQEAAHTIALKVAADAEQTMLQAGELERRILDQMQTALEAGELKPADLSGALRNVTTTKALNNDKISAPIRGRPSVITEHRSVDDIARKLEQLGVIEGTAVEVSSAHELTS